MSLSTVLLLQTLSGVLLLLALQWLRARPDRITRWLALVIALCAVGAAPLNYDPVGQVPRSIRILAKSGEQGVPGLERGVNSTDHHIKLMVLTALGDTGSGRAVSTLGRFMATGRGWRSLDTEYAAVARRSIARIGLPAVPYLSPYLQDSRRRGAARYCLYQITGRSFARQDEVAAWWSPHLRKRLAQFP